VLGAGELPVLLNLNLNLCSAGQRSQTKRSPSASIYLRANKVTNNQLLCGRCNRAKADRGVMTTMKLWSYDADVPPRQGFVMVVVMAETRQEAIEKARAELLRAQTSVFPRDYYRRFAQFGLDNLDTMNEVPEGMVILVGEAPSL
jgi:hypothetical protein